MNQQTIYKTPDEIITVDLDFSRFSPYDITTFLGYEITDLATGNSSSELVVEESQISNDKHHIYLKISGGVSGKIYILQVKVRFSNTDELEAVLYVIMEEFL